MASALVAHFLGQAAFLTTQGAALQAQPLFSLTTV